MASLHKYTQISTDYSYFTPKHYLYDRHSEHRTEENLLLLYFYQFSKEINDSTA